ncbi:glycosyltransferase [Fusobacterium russii]|uniref:glycosyltransferase n=1 Tax=Fusobacterium russii TaxID=854 RepID=UPI0003A085D0|nr:glycosyltransferase [Fusobacterium russii]
MKNKIFYLAENAHPSKQGGIETFGRILKKMFKTDLYCIAYQVTKKNTNHSVEDIIEIPTRGIFKYLDKLTNKKFRKFVLQKKINDLDYDIAILNYPEHVLFFKNKKNVKKILVQHVSFETFKKDMEKLSENFSNPEFLLKEIDYFIFLSESARDNFIKNFDLSDVNTRVIKHSSEILLLEKKKEKNRKLIMIARLQNEAKRFDLAIRAMKKLPEFTLEIYGDGNKTSIFLNNIIKEENITNVKILGPTNQVQEKLDEAAIFVMTSDHEGYGITLIEAARRGLPLIVRNTYEAAKEIVTNNGILLQKEWNEDEFVEGIKKIYNNYDYYSENSLKFGIKHNLELIKKEWENLFNEIRKK